MVMNGDLKLPCRGKMVEVALEDKVRHPWKKRTALLIVSYTK